MNKTFLKAVKAELREEQYRKAKDTILPYLQVIVVAFIACMVFTAVVQAINNVPQEVERMMEKQ